MCKWNIKTDETLFITDFPLVLHDLRKVSPCPIIFEVKWQFELATCGVSSVVKKLALCAFNSVTWAINHILTTKQCSIFLHVLITQLACNEFSVTVFSLMLVANACIFSIYTCV